jgi:hypothetical protein
MARPDYPSPPSLPKLVELEAEGRVICEVLDSDLASIAFHSPSSFFVRVLTLSEVRAVSLMLLEVSQILNGGLS